MSASNTDEIVEPMFPKFDYYLDESDPDVLVLRRQDGAFVGAFSASGATKEGIVEAARGDYQSLLQRIPLGAGEAHECRVSRKVTG